MLKSEAAALADLMNDFVKDRYFVTVTVKVKFEDEE